MSVNKVIFIGNVGKDPDVRYLDNDVCVAQFSLATTEKGYAKEDGSQTPDRTEWHNIVAWRGLAQTIEKYVKKGDKLYVEGKLRHSSYEDQSGIKRRRTDVYVDKLEMLTPKSEGKPLPPDMGAPAASNTPFDTFSYGSEQPKGGSLSQNSFGNDEYTEKEPPF